jgi:ATP-binding cassette subfamily B (MDR/TAP) protein 1
MHFMVYNRLNSVSSFHSATACVQVLRHHIERQPHIDIRDGSGIGLKPFSADCGYTPTITLCNVTFAYPSRPGIKALDNVSLVAEAGQLTAFVGPSGAGKSSIAGLLVRQYDPSTANQPNPHDLGTTMKKNTPPESPSKTKTVDNMEKGYIAPGINSSEMGPESVEGGGTILLDGIDLRQYNLRSLRSQISVVHQEPQLISGSVFDNIVAGLSMSPDNCQINQEEGNQQKNASAWQLCIDALKKAEAWDFVQDLPEEMDTQITGGRSGILSGGQQQRLAIARALIGTPAILILDEATSALSSNVELKVRNNLEKEQQERGLTIISIAHRLQFAQHANKIVVMQQGRIVDTGTYTELSSPERPDQTFARLLNKGSSEESQTLHADLKEDDKSSQISDTDGSQTKLSKPSSLEHSTRGTHDDAFTNSFPAQRKEASGLMRYISARRIPFFMMILFTVLNACTRVVFQLRIGQSNAKLSGAVDPMSIEVHSVIWLGYAFWWFAVTYGQESSSGITQKAVERHLALASAKSLVQQEISYYEEELSSAGMLTANLAKHTSGIAETFTISLTQVSSYLSLHQLDVQLIYFILQVGALALASLGTLVMSMILSAKFGALIFPLLLLAGAAGCLQIKALSKFETLRQGPGDRISTIINEAVDSIATIMILGQEGKTVNSIERLSGVTGQMTKWESIFHAAQAFGESLVFGVGALLFW